MGTGIIGLFSVFSSFSSVKKKTDMIQCYEQLSYKSRSFHADEK